MTAGMLRPHRTAVLFALSAALLSAGCRRPDDGTRLAYRFVTGQECRYRFTSSWTGRVEAPGQPPRTFDRREEADIRRLVESFDTGSLIATLRQVWAAHADERRLDATRTHAWSNSMVLRLRSNGGFVSLEGLEHDGGFYGRTYLEHLYAQSLPVFPAHPVQPGFTWTQKKTVPMPSGRNAAAEARFVFEGVQLVGSRRCAMISQANRLVIPFLDDGAQGVDESTGRGRLYLGLEDGLLVREEIEREVSPRRWYLIAGRQVPAPGRTQYHAIERLELVSVSPPPDR